MSKTAEGESYKTYKTVPLLSGALSGLGLHTLGYMYELVVEVLHSRLGLTWIALRCVKHLIRCRGVCRTSQDTYSAQIDEYLENGQ